MLRPKLRTHLLQECIDLHSSRACLLWIEPYIVNTYAAEPDILIEQLRKDEAIAEADTLLLTIPNQLGVAYNVHVMEAILTSIAPALGWH